jgi:hypothetical protein
MSEILRRILLLGEKGEIRISDHGYDELAEDDIFVRDVVDGVRDAKVVEEYPDYPKGASVLLLQRDRAGRAIHVVWGIPKGSVSPAVVVTAYRPDPGQWTHDLMRRKQ